MAKYKRYRMAQNINQKPSKTWNTVFYRVPDKQKPITIPSRKSNNCICASLVLTTHDNLNILETWSLSKLNNWNLSQNKFVKLDSWWDQNAHLWNCSKKQQQPWLAILSDGSRNLQWQWSRLSCFEKTASIPSKSQTLVE